MKFTTVALPLLASSLALAQPHRQHGHQHPAKRHQARNEPAIKWVTEYEYTTEVVPVTKTIWVSEGFVAPAESTSTTVATKKASVPAQFFQPASKKPSSSSTTLSTTTVSIAPAPVPTTSAKPTTTSATSAPPPPVEVIETKIPTTTTTAVPTPEPTPESVYTPPAVVVPTTTSQAPPAPVVSATPLPATGSGPGSSGGDCSKGSDCSGDITHYAAGLGACGWESDGEAEDVVALSHLLMGTQSNGNPFCGRYLTVKLGGKSVVARVVDKCMGCEPHAIDLSNHAFKQLEDMGVGRTKVEWSFNN